MTEERGFQPGERVKIVKHPKYNGNPHPQHKKGHVGKIDEPRANYEVFDGKLHVGVDGFYVQTDCLESLDNPPEPTKKEIAEALASIIGGRVMIDPIQAGKADAWEQGHKMCICTREWDIRPPCKNPYR